MYYLYSSTIHPVFQLTTSRRGRHSFYNCRYIIQYFNSRPHEEVDVILDILEREIFHFNSRPHEEVDILERWYYEFIRYFNSRPHEEVDQLFVGHLLHRSAFQLTTSRRGRRSTFVLSCMMLYFNSRPHEEVDPISLQPSKTY